MTLARTFRLWAGLMTVSLGCAGFASVARAAEIGASADEPILRRTFDVTRFGAVGDGKAVETAAIERALEACDRLGGGQVLFPPGRYATGTIALRSHVTLVLAAGARLVATTNLSDYRQPTPPSFMPEAKWGRWHRGLIVGENLEDVAIIGPGVIDGNRVFDPQGEEHLRGPHTIVMVNCRGFTLKDVTLVDSANYAVFLQISDVVEIRNVRFVGGWDGVHFRGAPNRWCQDVKILGCQFYTGDDAIAGRYWDNTVISGCVINSSCNGIRLIGPARHLIIHDCLFYGPGEQPHRTSNRTNMLSGIILQPGAWDKTEGPLDDVLVSGVTMKNVASPVTLWTKPGNPVGRVTVERLSAVGVYRSAISVESWAEEPVANVVLRDVQVEFDGGGKAWTPAMRVDGPGVDARPLPAWAVFARHVQSLTLEDVRVSCTQPDLRPVLQAERVDRLRLDQVRYTRVPGVSSSAVLKDVAHVRSRDTDLLPANDIRD